MTNQFDYDAVIVGGGLAGLAAATRLRQYRVLLLEKENRIGGRVLTFQHGNHHFDVGACFAFGGTSLIEQDSHHKYQLIQEEDDVGIFINGVVYFDSKVTKACKQIPVSATQSEELISFARSKVDCNALSSSSYELVNYLFKVINPGDLSQYSSSLNKYVFANFDLSHWAPGNQVATDLCLSQLTADIVSNTTVTKVEDHGTSVKVHSLSEGRESAISTRAAIVATPGIIAKEIIETSDNACARLLESVRYGAFTVVALVYEKATILPFRYISCVDTDLSTVIQQASADKTTTALLAYYDDRASQEIAHLDASEILAKAVEDLGQLSIGVEKEPTVLRSEIKRWKFGGTILTDEMLAARSPFANQASKRVFLAGDYTWPADLSYGMIDAVKSGLAAGELLKRSIEEL